ncbi:pyridoxal-dependent decarboxylase [Microcoleus sp. F4-D5]|uniref:pyridoxal-dependent decarboxylase n=1 Tax=Microcoleus sp. F4-D5 TaxID=2818760 RepID=UPI002FD25666
MVVGADDEMSNSDRRNGETQDSNPPSLDLTDDAMHELVTESVALIADYFGHIAEIPLFQHTAASKFADELSSELPIEGESIEQLMKDCRSLISATRHTGHPRFLGYIGSVSTPVGAFADAIASTLNPNVNSWRSAPAATELEKLVVRWLGLLVGYGENAQGLLTSGSSMANLNALLIAHRVKSPEKVSEKGLWNTGAPMTIYASDRVHFSIPKAADVLGLGRDCVRIVKSDAKFRLEVSSLRQRIEADLSNGFRPFCIVANAGTTATGAVDPLAEIARVAEEYQLWLHVDGAYGAFAALDPRKRHLFAGIELADSVSLDPHKWLYTPVDCGCLLFRNAAEVRTALSFGVGEFLQLHEETEAESFAFWDYGIELSRRFRALKIWMLLRYYGVRRISAAIANNNTLAEYLGDRVSMAEDFELLAPVELSICCFRYVPPLLVTRLLSGDETERASVNAEIDRLNARILFAVQRKGRAYLSNTTICGRYALRACTVNFRTTCADIDAILDIVRDTAHNLDK